MPKRKRSLWWAIHRLRQSGYKRAADFLSGKKKTPLGKKALALAATQIGTKESPPDSNNVKYNTWYYGKPVSGPEYAWCAVFVSWVLSHSGRPFKESYVPHIVSLALSKQGGLSVIPYSKVKAHLVSGIPVLACYDWEHDGTSDHVGFVEKVIDSLTFQAIEGNTGSINLSNGGEVMRATRYVSQAQVFVAVGAA
jgi:hypothetical protein